MNTRSPSFLDSLRAVLPPTTESDESLLNRFIAERSDSAFDAIVRRHGGLALDVCRSVLRNEADAEDAFQAVFLTLATRARFVRKPAALAAWLHGTAWRTANKARVAAARRRMVESAVPVKETGSAPDPSWTEVREAIHEEVNRLPERERAAVVLCYLAGLTQDAAGAALSLSRDGVKKRLERGRELLRVALARRGLGPLAVLAIAVVSPAVAPASLTAPTTHRAVGLATGTIASRLIPVGIRSLMEGGTMLISTVKASVAVTALAAATFFGFAPAGANDVTPAKPAIPGQTSADGEPAKGGLHGTWKLTTVSRKGKDLAGVPALEFVFDKGKLELPKFNPQQDTQVWDPTYLIGAKIRHNPNASPRTIDVELTGNTANGVTLSGIYQIRDGRLKIAIRTPQSANLPRPKGYATSSGTILALTFEPVVAEKKK